MPITAATTMEALPPESAPVQDEEESWLFNCRCGLKGQNIDACRNQHLTRPADLHRWYSHCRVRRLQRVAAYRLHSTPKLEIAITMAIEINIDEWQAKVFVCANCTRKRRKRAADLTASTPATPVKKPKTDRSKSATAPKTATSKTATKAAPAAPGLPTSKASANGHVQSVPHKLQTSTLASGQSSAQSSPCRSPLAAKSRSGNPRQSRPSRPPLSAGPAGMSETQIVVDAAVALTTHSNEQQQQQTMPPMGGMLTGLDAIVAALQSEAGAAFASSASSTQLSTHRQSSLHETGAPLDGLHPSPSKAPKASIAAIPRTALCRIHCQSHFSSIATLHLAAVTNSPTKSYADPSLLAAIFAAAPTLPAAPAAPQHSLVSAASPSLRAAAGDASE
ncbi:hypothetical protein BC831DRAFT_437441 [Entophlyctis helioformis]|nr:hypothetical protein BC831DRAFT_437441 [Entophlyctis helioformis]